MLKYFSADWIFPVSSAPIKNGAVCVDEVGKILEILSEDEISALNINVEKLKGAIVPGCINTHCHLELSHLFNVIPEKTGLPNFVRLIVANRTEPDLEVIEAMKLANEEMFSNGIVAVGDIANELISRNTKAKSKLYYHTFIEVFGFNKSPNLIIDEAIEIRNAYEPLMASIVPHAPYSVSKLLFNKINKQVKPNDVLTIHSQETLAETEFFENGTGSFATMYDRLNTPKEDWHGNGENSLKYHLPQLSKNNLILVHNTFTTASDVDFANTQHEKLFWCLCPNANLYIENNLPDVKMLMEKDATITLGTDSLASNHQLNILAEMHTLQQHKNLPFNNLICWATLNGAKALNIDAKYGSIEKGKTPGLNLIQLDDDFTIISDAVIKLL